MKSKGIKLSSIANAFATCSVPLGDGEDVLEVKFRRHFWTTAVEKEYFGGESRFSEKNAKIVVENVVEWNLLEDDGTMTPITAETVDGFDAFIVDALVNAMSAAVNPNKKTSQG